MSHWADEAWHRVESLENELGELAVENNDLLDLIEEALYLLEDVGTRDAAAWCITAQSMLE